MAKYTTDIAGLRKVITLLDEEIHQALDFWKPREQSRLLNEHIRLKQTWEFPNLSHHQQVNCYMLTLREETKNTSAHITRLVDLACEISQDLTRDEEEISRIFRNIGPQDLQLLKQHTNLALRYLNLTESMVAFGLQPAPKGSVFLLFNTLLKSLWEQSGMYQYTVEQIDLLHKI